MPDASKARARRRAKAAEQRAIEKAIRADEARRKANAEKSLLTHDELSRGLSLPDCYRQVAERDEALFLQSNVTIYRKEATATERVKFILKVNERMLGPFEMKELQCIVRALWFDLEAK